MDLAVDPLLADAARDELRVLRAEVEDQDQVRGSSLLEPVVRRFLGDDHVVDVALAQARLA